MKISSKSLLSPSHPRDAAAPVCLSTSLSRRLKTNRSLKGVQSPMFSSGGEKKRGSSFENSEPSSPKVTCIGQVRVKTKKKQGKKKIRTGEASFRKIEGENPNQRWVHLPLTICEALRGFGAEFSCLFPCRPSCFSTGEEKEKEGRVSGLTEVNGGSSCVAGRWLVEVHRTEIELVVGGEEGGGGKERGESNLGKDEEFEVIGDCDVEEEGKEEERVSVCIPPKNALLLMRCRSDPIRVSALVNRFWESPARNAEEQEEEGGDEDVAGESLTGDKEVEVFGKSISTEDEENSEAEVQDSVVDVQEAEASENPEEKMEISDELEEGELEPVVVQKAKLSAEAEAEENEASCSVSEVPDLQRFENEESVENPVVGYQPTEPQDEYIMCSDESFFDDSGLRKMFLEEEEEAAMGEETEEKSMGEKETQLEEEKVTQERSELEKPPRDLEAIEMEREADVKREQNRERSSVLPECLLLMMCEPKLSMEVSKETWVCSTDFIGWKPERRPVKKTDGSDGVHRKRVSYDSNPAPAAAMSLAAMIEKKLVNAVANEPFVLTRCKSEPMRTAPAKLAPEICFWKNRKLEPLRRATLGVGAAGIGF